jgi:hypothetical protein
MSNIETTDPQNSSNTVQQRVHCVYYNTDNFLVKIQSFYSMYEHMYTNILYWRLPSIVIKSLWRELVYPTFCIEYNHGVHVTVMYVFSFVYSWNLILYIKY